ncbi:YphA family membrane protein, partial [Bacillus pumilus]|uniref:YphA family membrane protein n=1 Tax=Bacillus pumilus TaxID=1408 RepID=UPI003C16D0EC
MIVTFIMEKSSWRNVLGVFVLVHIICSHFMISIFDMNLNAGYLMTFLYACAGCGIFRSGHQILRIIQLGSMVS